MHQLINQPMYLRDSLFSVIERDLKRGASLEELLNNGKKKVECVFIPIGTVFSTSNVSQNQNNKLVAVIYVMGVMSRMGNYYSYGYEDVANQILRAKNNPDVVAIVLKVYSPGGTADGCSTVCDAIIDARKVKPVVSQTAFAMSAGYMIASQSTEIIMDSSAAAMVGSIGSQYVHIDESKSMEQQGYDVTIFRAKGSERKNLINGIEPLSEDATAKIQSLVDACQREFVGYVKRGRMGKNLSSDALTGDEFNAKEAITLGLIDKVGSYEMALQRAIQLAA